MDKGIDKQCKAFMLTINNPIENGGYNHERIRELIHTKFKNIEYWCMADEIGASGNYHSHIYILLKKKKRWSSVQHTFPTAHIESEVRGNSQQCVAYIKKEGDKHKDKKETQVEGTFYEEGILPEVFITADKIEMLSQAEQMIKDGMRPSDIFAQSICFRQYETIIKKAFFDKRFSETPPHRDIKVIWHLGASGSGKSFSYTRLCEEYSPDEIYHSSDYANNCTALFDGYEAQKIVFLDEVKPDSFKYGYLLQILQGYRTPIHARFCNVYSLWTEIHITSIYTPHEIYEGMVDNRQKSIDTEQQLIRRITHYVYHWKDDDDGYHQYEIEAKDYHGLDDLRQKATGKDNFTPIEDNEHPFHK